VSGFKQHIEYGWFFHSITTIGVLSTTLIGVPIELILGLIGLSLPFTLFGSILPDIDHPASKPYRLFRYVLLFSIIVIISLLLSQNQHLIESIWKNISHDIHPQLVPITISIISLSIAVITICLFEKYRPNHRGITHKLIFGLIITIIIGTIFYYIYSTLLYNEYTILSSIIISLYFFMGFCSHLYADNMLKFPT